MSTKHFIKDPNELVEKALKGQIILNPAIALDQNNKVLFRRPETYKNTPRRVRILSGGGSGHEPSFSGFVGKGLLDAGVSGTVFASPSTRQIGAGIRLLDSREEDDSKVRGDHEPTKGGEGGILVVVMNYTGDVLNFGLAVEKARTMRSATSTSNSIEMVVVGDDVGVPRSQAGKVGRRGIAGTCLVLKIAGALAETGASLDEVTTMVRQVSENIVSVGASLSHVHVPGRSEEEYLEEEKKTLGSDEVEIGMGIHNEEGAGKVKKDLKGLVEEMLKQLLDSNDKDRGFLAISKEDEIVLLVNNLGGVSVLEMGGIVSEVAQQLQNKYSIKPVRILSGAFMTSLNGLGFSITLLRASKVNVGKGKSVLELLDAPTEALGWSAAVQSGTWTSIFADIAMNQTDQPQENAQSNLKMHYGIATKALTSGLNRLLASVDAITQYDTVVGDGDCGIGLERGAKGLLKMMEKERATDDVCVFMQRVVDVIEDTMDGTSGALYAIFMNAMLRSLQRQGNSHGSGDSEKGTAKQNTVGNWAKAVEDSIETLSQYTPAKPGDRTLIDALFPFASTLTRSAGNVGKAAEAAKAGADKTKGMTAKLGRSVYVGGKGFEDVPDPGAYGLAEFLMGLAEGFGSA